MTVSALVIRTAGINCDRETCNALAIAGFDVQLKHINELQFTKKPFEQFRLVAIPGGFSYGDDISAGKVLANELIFKFGGELKRFVREGNLVIGICNGFQALVKTGLLPGDIYGNTELTAETANKQLVTLMLNDSNRFEARWVHLRCMPSISKFVTEEEVIYLPVAHAEGKFVSSSDDVLDRMKENRQIVFRYCDENGGDADYPLNPNGSRYAIAGVCDTTGRVLGMMPHPERFWYPANHPRHLRTKETPIPAGIKLFKNAYNYVTE